MVDETGENQIVVSSGANLAARCVPDARDSILLTQLELPLETVALFLSTRRPRSIAILNAAPFHPDARPLFSLADIVVVNQVELAGYCNDPTPPTSESRAIDMATALIDRPTQTIIVTRGEHGSIAVGPEGGLATLAKVVQAVDTTGAGDCFCGFLAAGIATGQTLAVSVERAHDAAAISVGRWGAASSIPLGTELQPARI